MQPIEDLVATEFPNFDPFPWGQRKWIHGLVRHVLLAEAMVGDFAACFEGVTPDEAETMADAFRFDQCNRREPLIQILASASHGPRESSR